MNFWRPQKVVALGNGDTAIVQELDWPQAIEFLRQVGQSAQALIRPIASGEMDQVAFRAHLMSELHVHIGTATGLADYLLEHAVQRRPDETGSIKQRGVSDVLKVLGAALEINLSAEILEAAGGLGKTLGAAFGGTKKTDPTPEK